MSLNKKILLTGAILTASFSWAIAQTAGPEGIRPPPNEAFEACFDKSANAACSFQTGRGAMDGRCRIPPRTERLVCVPARGGARLDDHPPRPGGIARTGRQHGIVQSNGTPDLVPATEQPPTDNRYFSDVEGNWRIIRANAIPDHLTGQFPNSGNPNRISEQSISVRIPLNPEWKERATAIREPGWAVNGVPFDPGADEFFQGNRRSGWQYEALSGAIELGLDHNHAHVQPTGKYHYHGLPTLLLEAMNVRADRHSPIVGWATDGFPIYAAFGFSDPQDTSSGIVALTSSYNLKSGHRPSDEGNPGGHYDGTFTRDYQYRHGSGDLDDCNGRFAKTPEFPGGTYAYYLTESFPVIPRCLHGTPAVGASRP
ncbi:YHYH protein [Kiloniella sp. b19]|uniref:YHYH protein n=1 Tax=Kiloniella sp. GXU_MW_B19 TaxID=3141326 RepID=UPI0031D58FFE